MRINRSIFARAQPQYRIDNKEDEATVYLYDEISFFGIESEPFVKDLNSIKAKTINLRVNSPGGSVFDGMTIYNAIKSHPAKIIAHIDGLAASIASVVVMAADEVRASENTFFMIHEPWSLVIGSSDDMRQEADLLDKVQGSISKVYQDRSGNDEAQIKTWMAAETWFTAQEALDAGFIDAVDGNGRKESNLFDLSVFNNVPDALKGDKTLTERDLERILRDAGCSKRQAKSILAEGYKGELRDVAGPDPEPLRDVKEPEPEAPAERRDAVKEGRDKVAVLLAKAAVTRCETHIASE